MKITIEYDGVCSLATTQDTTEIKDGVRGGVLFTFTSNKEYELLLPKETKAKVTIEEDEVHKEKVIENVTIRIDSKVDQEKLKEDLFKVVSEQLKQCKLI